MVRLAFCHALVLSPPYIPLDIGVGLGEAGGSILNPLRKVRKAAAVSNRKANIRRVAVKGLFGWRRTCVFAYLRARLIDMCLFGKISPHYLDPVSANDKYCTAYLYKYNTSARMHWVSVAAPAAETVARMDAGLMAAGGREWTRRSCCTTLSRP
jgi:hypothetical protein